MSTDTLHTRICTTPVLVSYTDGEPDGIAYYDEMDVYPRWLPEDLADAIIASYHQHLCMELAYWHNGAKERALESQADDLYHSK